MDLIALDKALGVFTLEKNENMAIPARIIVGEVYEINKSDGKDCEVLEL